MTCKISSNRLIFNTGRPFGSCHVRETPPSPASTHQLFSGEANARQQDVWTVSKYYNYTNSKQVWTTQTDSIWSSPPPSLPFARRMTAAPGMWCESWVLEHSVTGAGSKCFINCMGSIKYSNIHTWGTVWCCLAIPSPSSKLRVPEEGGKGKQPFLSELH